MPKLKKDNMVYLNLDQSDAFDIKQQMILRQWSASDDIVESVFEAGPVATSYNPSPNELEVQKLEKAAAVQGLTLIEYIATL